MAKGKKVTFIGPAELAKKHPEHIDSFKMAAERIERLYGERVLQATMASCNYRQICAMLHDIYNVPHNILGKMTEAMVEIFGLTDLDPEKVEKAAKLMDRVILAARASVTAEELLEKDAGKDDAAAVIEKAKGTP